MFRQSSFKFLLIALLTSASSGALAVDEWWNEIGTSIRMHEYDVGIATEQRMRDGGTDHYLTNIKLNLSRALTDNLKAGLMTRYENTENKSGSHTEGTRVAPYLSHKLSLDQNWAFASRLMAENLWRHGDHRLRGRLQGKFSRRFDSFSLFGSYEYFYNLTDSSGFDRSWSAIGYSTSLSARWGLVLYYQYQNKSNNTSDHILGSKFKYKF